VGVHKDPGFDVITAGKVPNAPNLAAKPKLAPLVDQPHKPPSEASFFQDLLDAEWEG